MSDNLHEFSVLHVGPEPSTDELLRDNDVLLRELKRSFRTCDHRFVYSFSSRTTTCALCKLSFSDEELDAP